jgi:hypothetical protein
VYGVYIITEMRYDSFVQFISELYIEIDTCYGKVLIPQTNHFSILNADN